MCVCVCVCERAQKGRGSTIRLALPHYITLHYSLGQPLSITPTTTHIIINPPSYIVTSCSKDGVVAGQESDRALKQAWTLQGGGKE